MLHCPTRVDTGCVFTEDVGAEMIFLGGQFGNLVILSSGAQRRDWCESRVIGNQYQYQSLGPVWDIWPWRDTYRAACQERMNVTMCGEVIVLCVHCSSMSRQLRGQLCKQVKVPICFLRLTRYVTLTHDAVCQSWTRLVFVLSHT